MRILICDDDQDITIKTKKIIISFFHSHSLKIPEIIIYHSGEELLADKNEKNIVFLDIEMPGLSGIFVGNELKKENDRVIIFIITSYAEYLDEAMKFHVFRYISKPLDKERIFRNMTDALELYNSVCTKVPIETHDGIVTVPLSEIIFVEVSLRTVTVHTLKQNYVSINNMHYWLEKLNYPAFFSPHRSFIINLEYVSDFDHSIIHLYNDRYTAYLTRRKYTEFKDAYLLYLESQR